MPLPPPAVTRINVMKNRFEELKAKAPSKSSRGCQLPPGVLLGAVGEI
jgi:hypothetical protein